MAIIKKDKLKEMSNQEIDQKIKELRLEISKELSITRVGSQAKNPGNIKNMKRMVARLITKRGVDK